MQTIIPYQHKAHYYETDKMGIIHHSNYMRWFEEARVDFMEQIGCSYDQMEKRGIGSPVLAISCQYKSMVRFNDMVMILPKVEFFNGVKLTISYRVLAVDTLELKATGESSHCFLNTQGRPISLKKNDPEFYDLLLSYLGIDITY